MVLDPVQVVRGHAEVLSTLVPHDELGPEDSQVQLGDRPVLVQLGQRDDLLFITVEKKE